MGVLILIILGIVLVAIISGSNGKGSAGRTCYYGGYARDYDEDDFDDYEDYSDSEISAARGDRNYFSDDPADDYNSYYAQIADDAMMGDSDAMDEMRGEFGDGEW